MTPSFGWAALSLIIAVMFLVTSSEGQFRNSLLGGSVPSFGPAVEAVADLRYPSSPLRAVRPRRQFLFGGQKQSTFSLLRQLISETASDTRTAFNQIGDILGSQFEDASAATSTTTIAPEPPVEVNGTTSTTTTTEAPYRISRQEFLNILQRNAVGLGRLFRKQYDTAIQDSSVNLNRFKQEFKMAVRPFLEPAPPTTTTTSTTSS